MKLSKEKALRIEVQNRKNGGPRKTYIFNCLQNECYKEIRIRCDAFKKATGYCQVHAQRKRPFESIYNSLKRDWRKTEILLSYEEFLEFTNIKHCYYCNSNINWNSYSIDSGQYISRAYNLDRKDNNGPYSRSNCVVCCARCNKFKGSFDHNEFIVLCNLISDTFKKRIT